jgi:hypothetical protein
LKNIWRRINFFILIIWLVISPIIAYNIIHRIETYEAQIGSPSIFEGSWSNSTNTRSITKAILFQGENNTGVFKVNFFGSCVPFDCNWGVTNGYYSDKKIYGEYVFDYKTTSFDITLTNKGELNITQVNEYNYGRPDLISVDILHRN